MIRATIILLTPPDRQHMAQAFRSGDRPVVVAVVRNYIREQDTAERVRKGMSLVPERATGFRLSHLHIRSQQASAALSLVRASPAGIGILKVD